MAYCTYQEVQSDFKSLDLTATSLVTITDVQGFITESDALINSYLGMRYKVPIISGPALDLLKLYSRSLTSLRIKRLLEVVQTVNTEANQVVKLTLLSEKDVIQNLKDIRDGKAILPGTPELTKAGGFNSFNTKNCIKPVFKKGEKQW